MIKNCLSGTETTPDPRTVSAFDIPDADDAWRQNFLAYRGALGGGAGGGAPQINVQPLETFIATCDLSRTKASEIIKFDLQTLGVCWKKDPEHWEKRMRQCWESLAEAKEALQAQHQDVSTLAWLLQGGGG